MDKVLDMLEYVLRLFAGLVFALLSMCFAVFIGLFSACGEGLAWVAKKLVEKYDNTDENVKEVVTEE